MMDVIGHHPASLADAAPGDAVFGVPFDPNDPALFHLQQETATGMAQTTVGSPGFAHGIHLRFMIFSACR
jgi:hypothetical protein